MRRSAERSPDGQKSQTHYTFSTSDGDQFGLLDWTVGPAGRIEGKNTEANHHEWKATTTAQFDKTVKEYGDTHPMPTSVD